MRVMHVIAGAEAGGAETFFADAACALDRAGLAQVVVTRPNAARLARLGGTGAAVYTAPFGNWRRGPTRRVLEAAFAAHRPDIVQYWMGRAGGYALRRPEAVHVGWFGGYYDVARFKGCDYFVGVTQGIVDHIVRSGVPPARARLIHTYADLDDAPALDRRAFATPDGRPLLLVLARLHKKKGLDTLLEALAAVPEPVLWIAGEGPERGALEALCRRLALADRVRFLGWRDDRGALLRAADLCVFPSRYEPFGTVMVEAWGTGVPLIAAAAAGPKAYVRDGENGLLVPVDDAAALAASIRRCLDDAALRRRLVAGGRATFEAAFTEASFVAAATSFYAEILAERGGGAAYSAAVRR
jgi:glycosyltransferase involved in cell wall biosynthesis